MRRPTLALALITLALLIPSTANAAQLSSLGSFAQPAHLAAPPGDNTRLMVVEKGGAIRVWHKRGDPSGLFLDVAAAVGGIQSTGEQGLLSMAFAPDYATSGRFYVYYTAADGQSNRIDEFRVSPDRSVADPLSRRQVLVVPHTTAANHNGGQIAFGPDGLLYAAPGDGGNTPTQAQDTTSLLGKVLRIDPDPSGPSCPATPSHCYSSPSTNPFAGATPGRDEILHLGLRNPFRFSFDSSGGDLVIGDVGAGLQEEVTLIAAGTPGGRNLGWPICEGTSCSAPAPANYLAPALAYSQASPRAVTGGVVVRDPRLPELSGRYIYADFYEGVIRSRSLVAGAGAPHGDPIGPTLSNLASFSEDNGGCVYVTSLNGGVYRISPDGTAGSTPCSPPDTTPPETTIDSGPSGGTNSSDAEFSFAADEAGSSFACRLDGGGWAACSSPKRYAGLPPGNHTFSVRAADPAGNVDSTPASRTWRVETGGSTPAPAPTPASALASPLPDLTAPRLGISRRTIRTRRGRARVRLFCPATESGGCRGRLRIVRRVGRRTRTLGSARFSRFAGGRSKVVSVRLTRVARRLLRRSSRIRVRVRVRVADDAGNARTLSGRRWMRGR